MSDNTADAGTTPRIDAEPARCPESPGWVYHPHGGEGAGNEPAPERAAECEAAAGRTADGHRDAGHGDVDARTPAGLSGLRQSGVKDKATGLPAVLNSFWHGVRKGGPLRGTLPLLQLNQEDGFDCMSCAWPDADGPRPTFHFCENGAKAVAHERDHRRVDAAFFAEHPVAELSTRSDYWLEAQGRLTEPMVLREGATHYEPIAWEEAFELIADALNGLGSPDEAVFYTSGRATNEAAFAYQLFVRQYGTNNLPDCSNMCHESSGVALTRAIGIGKGTVKLSDFAHAKLIFVVGQNPGTNHPRQLSALQQAKRNGATIVSVNPLPEAGLMAFMDPQEALGLLGKATKLSDHFLQVRINGDVPLFKGILKRLVELDDEDRGSALDWNFLDRHAEGVEELLEDLRAADWEDLVTGSGIEREKIEEIAGLVAATENVIACWAVGLTQHHNGPGNVQELVNMLLLRGAIGKVGAGPCCVRGHSNVQGDRTMGVWERPTDSFLDGLDEAFGMKSPREHGLDVQKSILAMHDGRGKVFVSLGGNLLSAAPDTDYVAEALAKTDLTVRIGTKLNRFDLVTGKRALILPCFGRTELDVTEHGPQLVSVENSMGVVSKSQGRYDALSEDLMGETAVVCRIAEATLRGRTGVDWRAWSTNYDHVRDGIAKAIPGCEDYNARVRHPGGFYLPNGARERVFNTPVSRARLTINPLPRHELRPGQLVMMTMRSHDQFNTTVYSLHDRYRGLHNERRIVMMNREDMQEAGLSPRQVVDVTSHFRGQERTARGFVAVPYPIPRRNAAMYFPEANVLMPVGSTEPLSNIPTYKHTVITVHPARAGQTTPSAEVYASGERVAAE